MRYRLSLAATAVLALALTTGVGAQTSIVVSGGASVPLGAFSEVARLGGQGQLGLAVGQDTGVRFAAIGFFDRNPHRIAGDHSLVYGLNALVGFGAAGPAQLRITPWGGLGGAVHARRSDQFPGLNASKRGLAVIVGTTVARRFGRVSPFLSAFYERGLGGLHSEGYPTGWVSIGGGVEIPLGIR